MAEGEAGAGWLLFFLPPACSLCSSTYGTCHCVSLFLMICFWRSLSVPVYYFPLKF